MQRKAHQTRTGPGGTAIENTEARALGAGGHGVFTAIRKILGMTANGS